MKATRLKTYWRKICEDERRARHRNEMLLRDFDRIDQHMSELNARAQRLAVMKKEYEDYISRTYPKWDDLLHSSPDSYHLQEHGQLPELDKQGGASSRRSEPPTNRSNSQGNNRELDIQTGVKYVEQQQWLSHHELKQGKSHEQKGESHEEQQQEKNLHEQQRGQSHQGKHQGQSYQEQQQVQSYQEQQRGQSYQEQQQGQSYQEQQQGQSYQEQQQGQRHQEEPKKIPGQIAVSDTHTGIQPMVPSSSGIYANLSLSLASEASKPNDLILQADTKLHPQTDTIANQEETMTPIGKFIGENHHNESTGEETSDLGSDSEIDVDLPMGIYQVGLRTPPASSKHESHPTVDRSSKPDLSVDGLLKLLQFVEHKVQDTSAPSNIYRQTSLPDPAKQIEIIRKANGNEDLNNMNIQEVTGVILAEIGPIVRKLPEGCLFAENLLQDMTGLTEAIFRKYLTPDGQVVWTALNNHFLKLMDRQLISAHELSIVFSPNFVAGGKLFKEAQELLVQLLEGEMTGFQEEQIIPTRVKQSGGKIIESSESYVENGQVPPLKFGSLLDKQMTDDETSYVNSSLPADPVPLNATEAYQHMVSQGGSGQQQRQMSGQDDTDDDVEKLLASNMNKNPVPTKTTSGIGGSRFQGFKIGSDLDTDTEVDAGIFGSSKHPDYNSDFDFYD